jgi:hypothetical protein
MIQATNGPRALVLAPTHRKREKERKKERKKERERERKRAREIERERRSFSGLRERIQRIFEEEEEKLL